LYLLFVHCFILMFDLMKTKMIVSCQHMGS